MSQTCSPSTRWRYGLARVCRVWAVARSTVVSSRSRVLTNLELASASYVSIWTTLSSFSTRVSGSNCERVV
jgi:hypothetical protein